MLFRLSDMTWEDVEKLLALVVAVPVGSTEQHGRHLPLGCDTFVAIDLVEAAAEKTDVVVAPTVWYGMSPHHMVLPGTVSIRPEILLEFHYDVISSLAQHGFRKFVMVNGHRVANIPWMQLVGERVHRQLSGCRVTLFDPAWMSKEIVSELGFGMVGHAEEIETSHMLAAKPELTRMEKVEDHVPADIPLYHIDPRDQRDTLCYVPASSEVTRDTARKTGGNWGRPTLSDREKGQRYREHLIMRLVQVIEQM